MLRLVRHRKAAILPMETMFPALTKEDKRLIQSKAPNQKHQFAASRLLLADMAKEMGFPQYRLYKNDRGQPFVLASGKLLHISISHTVDAVAIAIGTEEIKVGIDIERADRKCKRGTDKMFLSKNERSAMKRSTNKGQSIIESWTKKEAYLKYLGVGLCGDLRSIDTTKFHESNCGTFMDGEHIISIYGGV